VDTSDGQPIEKKRIQYERMRGTTRKRHEGEAPVPGAGALTLVHLVLILVHAML
jgi:hypothetical protein